MSCVEVFLFVERKIIFVQRSKRRFERRQDRAALAVEKVPIKTKILIQFLPWSHPQSTPPAGIENNQRIQNKKKIQQVTSFHSWDLFLLAQPIKKRRLMMCIRGELHNLKWAKTIQVCLKLCVFTMAV